MERIDKLLSLSLFLSFFRNKEKDIKNAGKNTRERTKKEKEGTNAEEKRTNKLEIN